MCASYLGLAEAGTGRGVDGNTAVAFLALYDDGDGGQLTVRPAFCLRPQQQQHHRDSSHHHLGDRKHSNRIMRRT